MNEDAKLLRFAGSMGHTYVGIVGEPGGRRIDCECASLDSAKRLGGDDPTLTVYTRGPRKKWLACFDRRQESLAAKINEINAEKLKQPGK